jgi:subtilisin family serine protease
VAGSKERSSVPLVGGALLALVLFGMAATGSGAASEPKSSLTLVARPVAAEPPAVVPTGKALDALIGKSKTLVVGARNEVRAGKLLRSAGGRRLLTRVSVWVVPSGKVKRLLGQMNTPEAKLARFVELPADRDSIVEPMPPPQPYGFTDPLATPTYSWHVYAIGANQVPAAGPGFPITVFDSGLDPTHPDFAGRPNTFFLNEQSVALSSEDYHGTMVASTAAAALNGVGAEGIYAAAALRSYDFDYSTAESYYGGFEAAARAGPSVVNMSFGGTEESRADYEANMSTFAGGSLLVAAAGNEYDQGNPTNYPGAYPHVLTVAATDQTGAPTSFSSSGPQVDLAAPGVAIPVQDPQDPQAYFPVDGTSFAAPIVSAAAAWVMTVRPMEKTQLFDAVRWTARDTGQLGWDQRTGYGILDIPTLFSAALPSVDPQEPNDDIDQVTAGAMFAKAKTSINGAGTNASVSARLDAAEDPRDVYRVVVPAKRTVTLTVSADANLALELWSTTATTVWTGTRGRLGAADRSGGPDTLTWANRGSRSRIVYVNVRPSNRTAQHLTAKYTLRVRVSKSLTS